MHTLMYLMRRLDTAEAMVASLQDLNIGHDAYRVISKDEDGIRSHHLHDGTLIDRTDVVHSGERGALMGGAIGLLFALMLAMTEPLGFPLGWGGFLAVMALIGFFGAWVGGMVGLSHENYKLKPFHQALEEGQYLMAIGVRDIVKAEAVRQTMMLKHPDAIFMADDETAINPFVSEPEFRLHQVK